MNCHCSHNRLAVVRNPIRPFGRGEFERTGDFGRGTFERTGSFGGWFGDTFSWIGKNILLPFLPTGLGIGAQLATQAIFRRPSAGQPQQSQQQSAFTDAAAQAEADAAARVAEEKTKQVYIIVGAAAAVALFLIYRSRKK